MARKLRFISEPDQLVLVTTRVLHGLFLLKPSAELNPLLIGILARAQRLTGMKVCFFSPSSPTTSICSCGLATPSSSAAS